MAELLSDEEIEEGLPEGWERDGDEVVRAYAFDEYLEGVGFAGDVGELADEEFHHPEMIVRFDEVEVRFTSHEEGGITEQDLEMAERCNELY